MAERRRAVQLPAAKRTVNPSQRRAEIAITSLFLLTAAVSLVGGSLLDPMLDAPNYLAWVFPIKGAVQLDALLTSVNNIGIVVIAAFAFPLWMVVLHHPPSTTNKLDAFGA